MANQCEGESVSQFSLKNKAFSTFLGQNPQFELQLGNGVSPIGKRQLARLLGHQQGAPLRWQVDCQAMGEILTSRRDANLRADT